MNQMIQKYGISKVRWTIIAVVAAMTLLLGSVSLAQDSQNFDLACRGALTTTGGIATGGSVAVLGAVGQVGVGNSQSANWGVRAGYVQPRGSVANSLFAQAATTATGGNGSALESGPDRQNADDNLFLPVISVFTRYVHPCNW